MYSNPLHTRIDVQCREGDDRWRAFGVNTWDRLMMQIMADKLERIGQTRPRRQRSYHVYWVD